MDGRANLKHSETLKSRVKKGWKDWMGTTGADMSAIDVADIEVMANKLSYTTKVAGKLDTPNQLFQPAGHRTAGYKKNYSNMGKYFRIR